MMKKDKSVVYSFVVNGVSFRFSCCVLTFLSCSELS